jgi:hypothetical protein
MVYSKSRKAIQLPMSVSSVKYNEKDAHQLGPDNGERNLERRSTNSRVRWRFRDSEPSTDRRKSGIDAHTTRCAAKAKRGLGVRIRWKVTRLHRRRCGLGEIRDRRRSRSGAGRRICSPDEALLGRRRAPKLAVFEAPTISVLLRGVSRGRRRGRASPACKPVRRR